MKISALSEPHLVRSLTPVATLEEVGRAGKEVVR